MVLYPTSTIADSGLVSERENPQERITHPYSRCNCVSSGYSWRVVILDDGKSPDGEIAELTQLVYIGFF